MKQDACVEVRLKNEGEQAMPELVHEMAVVRRHTDMRCYLNESRKFSFRLRWRDFRVLTCTVKGVRGIVAVDGVLRASESLGVFVSDLCKKCLLMESPSDRHADDFSRPISCKGVPAEN